MDGTFVKPLSKSRIFQTFCGLGFLCACSSGPYLEVRSTPSQAEVFYINAKLEKKSLGKTPLAVTKEELRESLGGDAQAEEPLLVSLERPGSISQSFTLPGTKSGASRLLLTVPLQPINENDSTRAKIALDHVYLAQKLALTQQYERAQIELDQVLREFPSFAKAQAMRASIYYAQGNLRESLKWFEASAVSAPDLDESVKMSAKIRQQLKLPPIQKANP
jgi:tetratricopeptide (TPR) repeat protein